MIADVADAIKALKAEWKPPGVILAGHSGGAAIAADVAALYPGMVQHVFLVGCPCDVPAFRRHMARAQWSPMWLIPVRSLSPMQTLNEMEPGTTITAISGANDPIALPQYARDYVEKARSRGIAANGHEIFDNPAVIAEIANSAR